MRIIMARPIRETPVLKGEDAFNFEMRRLEVEHMSKEQRAESRRKFEARVAEAKKYINVCIWFMILVRLTPDYELTDFEEWVSPPDEEGRGWAYPTDVLRHDGDSRMIHITNTPYAMPYRERLNNINEAKRITESFGYSDCFLPIHLWPSTADNDNTNKNTLNDNYLIWTVIRKMNMVNDI